MDAALDLAERSGTRLRRVDFVKCCPAVICLAAGVRRRVLADVVWQGRLEN
jgi:hypothetical protein